MIHDPRCPLAPGDCLAPGPHQIGEANRYCWKCCSWCQCDLIAKVEQRVLAEQLAGHEMAYEQGQQDVFALHTEWTVTGMCKPECLPCQRLNELIKEREAGYSEGQRDAIAAAVQRVEAFRPLLGRTPFEGGYDCCGCNTLDELYEDCIAAITTSSPPPHWVRFTVTTINGQTAEARAYTSQDGLRWTDTTEKSMNSALSDWESPEDAVYDDDERSPLLDEHVTMSQRITTGQANGFPENDIDTHEPECPVRVRSDGRFYPTKDDGSGCWVCDAIRQAMIRQCNACCMDKKDQIARAEYRAEDRAAKRIIDFNEEESYQFGKQQAQRAAIQRVEALRDLGDAGSTYVGLVDREAVIAAIRGEQE